MTFQVSLGFLVFIWRSCERFPSLDTFKESWAAGNLRGLRTRSYLRNHICKPWVCWWQQCWRCWRGGGRGWRGGPSDLQSRPSGSGMTYKIRWQTDLGVKQFYRPSDGVELMEWSLHHEEGMWQQSTFLMTKEWTRQMEWSRWWCRWRHVCLAPLNSVEWHLVEYYWSNAILHKVDGDFSDLPSHSLLGRSFQGLHNQGLSFLQLMHWLLKKKQWKSF